MSERKNEVFGRSDVPASATRNVMRDDFGLEVPVVACPLPSEGKVYPHDHVLHGKDIVELRGMTAQQEDILTSQALMKKGTVIDELLKSCIVTPGVDVSSMLAGDRNAVMISIRITGHGQHYNADIVCKSCGEKVEASFDLSKLSIKKLDIEPVAPGQNLFEYQLPMVKKKVQFKFMTGADERDLFQESERRKKVVGSQIENLVTSRLNRMIVSVEGITDRSKIGMFVKNIPAGDSRALRKYIEVHEPGIDMKSPATCPLCHEEQEVEMPIGVAFFWPNE